MEARIHEMELILSTHLEWRKALVKLNLSGERYYSHLRPKQLEAVRKAQEGDSLVILKTGYGKSLIFELLPHVNDTVIVIACPLDAILDQLMAKFTGNFTQCQ